VTGATGFVGSHVARALVARGDSVRVTVRGGSSQEALAGLDVERVTAALDDRAALRRALRGVERLFHVAGTTHLRASPAELARVNVEGTRLVMEEALRAGVERAVHTSSIGAVGPARPDGAVTERAVFPPGLGVPYAESKHAAEAEALRVAARGLPLVIVNPSHVFGRGDVRPTSTGVVRRFLLRRIPAYVPGAINIVDVQDVAAGHLLADERGAPGERYILGGRNYTWARLFAELERLSGIEGPRLCLPVGVALAVAEATERAPGPTLISVAEVRAAGHWWTCRSTKARRELGWTTRPHEDTVEQTVRWWQERLGRRLDHVPRSQPAPLRLAALAARGAAGLRGRLPG
jgi:dihydroflavonol-4-reductase